MFDFPESGRCFGAVCVGDQERGRSALQYRGCPEPSVHFTFGQKVNLQGVRIGHILRRNCLLKQVIEGKIKGEIEVTRRRGRRCKKLLDDLKDRRGYSHLKEEALDRTMWRNRFGRGFGLVVRQITE